MKSSWRILLGFLALVYVLPVHAKKGSEHEAPKPEKEATEATPEPDTGEGISTIEVLIELHNRIRSNEAQLKENLSEAEKKEISATLQRLRDEIDWVLVGKDSLELFNQDSLDTSIQDELMDIFDPLIGEVKSATADSREKEGLRSQIELLTQKQTAIDLALRRLEINLKSKGEGSTKIPSNLKKILAEKESKWKNRKDDTEAELRAVEKQLKNKEEEGTNAVESASKLVAKFFKTRGFHLVLATLLAILAWFLITFAHKSFVKVSPFHQKEEFLGTSKTIDGAVHLGAILFAVLTVILTFFLCDDWVLLSATILVFVGIFWALKDRFSDMAEEIRLILNVGSVREGERIIFQGLSWRVEKLRVYSSLVNPELEGGYVRIPLCKMVGLHSRPSRPIERYFPTSLNDWVLLSDGTFGKVLHQTPEYVEMVQLGGSRKTYQTLDFLAQTPENLSQTSFRISTTFGIDYKHQESVTSEIASVFQKEIEDGLKEHLEESGLLRRLKVEFSSAATSYLDLAILADFNSDAAPKYNELTRLIQKLAVEVCNRHGWEIPFTQITVHQAEG